MVTKILAHQKAFDAHSVRYGLWSIVREISKTQSVRAVPQGILRRPCAVYYMAVSILIGSGIVKQVFTTQAFYFDRMAGPSGTELGGTRPPSSYVVAAERCSVTTEHCCVPTELCVITARLKMGPGDRLE